MRINIHENMHSRKRSTVTTTEGGWGRVLMWVAYGCIQVVGLLASTLIPVHFAGLCLGVSQFQERSLVVM